MKNSGIAIGLVAIGVGLTTIGINLNGGGTTAHATPLAVQGAEPTIVWYGTGPYSSGGGWYLLRAWSDGTVEARRSYMEIYTPGECTVASHACATGWFVIASPTEGLSAAADINFDERVDGGDLALLLSNWGDSPRFPIPASECPLAMINP